MKKNNGTTETPASVICDGEQQVGACPVVSPLRQVTNPVGSTYTADSTKTIAEEMESIAPTCENDWMDQLIDWATRLRALPPTELGGVEAVGEVGPNWTLVWRGADSIASIARRHWLNIGSPLYTTPRAAEAVTEYEYEVWQNGEWQAGGSCTDIGTAKEEAGHYATMYGQDGPVVLRLYEKREITEALTTPSAKGKKES